MGDPKHQDDSRLGPAYREVNESFNKTPHCPICRRETGLRRATSGTAEEIAVLCFNESCTWNAGTHNAPLPFLIVDRDVYRHAPAVLLGVIDKLALIGQHPATINRVMGMFGFARWRERDTGRFLMPSRNMLKKGAGANNCQHVAPAYQSGAESFFDPFPSLIIQDEAHLLEESLGTFAGLFETMLEQLLVRGADLLGDRVARSPFGARPVRLPKVIAATATVSVPQLQFGTLYQRRHMHFPYPGTSIYRSFYAMPAVPVVAARRGISAGGPRAPEIEAPWMRTYASLMTNGRNHTVTTVSVLAAYHLAITELWQDLLSGDRRDAAVRRIREALSRTVLASFHEAAIRGCAEADPAVLPTLVDFMRISLTYVTNKKGGDQVIDAFREEVSKTHRRYGRTLAQLHTRLISGGVDVAQIQEIMRDAEGLKPAGRRIPRHRAVSAQHRCDVRDIARRGRRQIQRYVLRRNAQRHCRVHTSVIACRPHACRLQPARSDAARAPRQVYRRNPRRVSSLPGKNDRTASDYSLGGQRPRPRPHEPLSSVAVGMGGAKAFCRTRRQREGARPVIRYRQ